MADSRPVPDPTRLTTEALLREMQHSDQLNAAHRAGDRELYNSKIAGVEQLARMLDEKVAKMDNRLTTVEAGGRGRQEAKSEGFNSTTVVMGLIFVGVTLLAQIIFNIISYVHSLQH